MFDSGRDLFEHMKEVERHERRQGRRHEHLSFLVYDENFLRNRELVEELRVLNREQLLTGPQYLLFVFSDATVLSEYTVEELLETGIDTVWVGVESPSLDSYDKLHDVDARRLVESLSGAGIKVFASMIAGLEGHTEALIRQDIEHALALPTIGVQYMPVNPIPGTTYYDKLKSRGLLLDRDPSWFSMSHYNVRHPELTEETVLGLIREFYEREHMENGPLVLRFLQGRFDGWRRYRHSDNPYVRARTRIYARDLLRATPVILAGEAFAPSRRTRRRARRLRRDLQRHFGRLGVLSDLLAGRLSSGDGGRYLVATLPGVRSLLRQLLKANATLRDPRTGGPRGLLRAGRSAVSRAQRGRIPWGQPETVRTVYPRAAQQE